MELSFQQMVAAYLAQLLRCRFHLRCENPIRRWLGSDIPANDISCPSATAHSASAKSLVGGEYACSLNGFAA